MSRYDRDDPRDESRDSSVRRPAESSGRQHTSNARGQGGDSLHQQPPRREMVREGLIPGHPLDPRAKKTWV
jgi:hypothetical protein